RGQIEIASGFLAAMAVQAVADERRADERTKELQPLFHLAGVILGNGSLVRAGGGMSRNQDGQDEADQRLRQTRETIPRHGLDLPTSYSCRISSSVNERSYTVNSSIRPFKPRTAPR